MNNSRGFFHYLDGSDDISYTLEGKVIVAEKAWWGEVEQGPDAPDASLVRPKNNKASIIGSLTLVAVLTAGLVGATFYKPNPYAERPGIFNSIEHPATVEGVINECGSIYEYNPPARHYGQIPVGYKLSPQGERVERNIPVHPMLIPGYGYMANDETKVGDNVDHFFSTERTDVPDREQILRLMWDGWTVIWYLPPIIDRSNLTADEIENTFNPTTIEAIKSYAEQHDKVIAVPWKGPKDLPMNRNMGISRWAVTQSCGVWSNSVVDEFINQDKSNPKPRPKEPPFAQVNEEGNLNEIHVDQRARR